jgi:Rod binding domain-containing protein
MNISALQTNIADPEAAKSLKAAGAAGQFESLLIAQMLKSMREEGSGWLGTGSDKTADTAVGFAEEQLATALSSAGGLGLAKIVQSGLKAPGVTEGLGTVADSKSVVGKAL